MIYHACEHYRPTLYLCKLRNEFLEAMQCQQHGCDFTYVVNKQSQLVLSSAGDPYALGPHPPLIVLVCLCASCLLPPLFWHCSLCLECFHCWPAQFSSGHIFPHNVFLFRFYCLACTIVLINPVSDSFLFLFWFSLWPMEMCHLISQYLAASQLSLQSWFLVGSPCS